jgi:DNA-binding response OmpR family regulator
VTSPTGLLIVDDDADLRRMLRAGLEPEGFAVLEAGDAEIALYEFATHAVDAVVVDLRLPGMTGIELARELRRRSDVPLLAVTAQTSEADVLACFDAGVDDVLAKPIGIKELGARISALLRRHTGDLAGRRSIRLGALEVTLPAGDAMRSGAPIELNPVESKLLAVLAEQVDCVVAREELAERTWGPGRLDDLRVVDEHIERLRRQLGAPAWEDAVIDTVGLGYRLRHP